MTKETGGSAFPFVGSASPLESPGMTLRDYFAAKAMNGIFIFWVAVNAKAHINDPDPKIIAEMAYEYADAMLKERVK